MERNNILKKILIFLAALIFLLVGVINIFIYFKLTQLKDLSSKFSKKEVSSEQATSFPTAIPSSSTFQNNQVDEGFNFKLYVYNDKNYGFKFYYPNIYTISRVKDMSFCRSFHRVGEQPPDCIFGVELLNKNAPFEYIPPIYFFLIKGIDKVVFAGQVREIYYDSKRKHWIDFDSHTQKVLSVWKYTQSNLPIFLSDIGGSQSSHYYYIIPKHNKDLVAVFITPTSYRLRCDIIEDLARQNQCISFYRKIVKEYPNEFLEEDAIEGWLPPEYLEYLYPTEKIRYMVKSFSFLED